MLDFHLYLYDQDFDLVQGALPPNLEGSFGDQLNRARTLLAGRSPAELDYALESLGWMLEKGSRFLFDQVIATTKAPGDSCFINRVKALQTLVPEIDIEDQANFLYATWTEYFAVLALAYVVEALYAVNNSQQIRYTPASDEPSRGVISVDWPVECMEAVCYAEHLQREAQLLDELNTQRTTVQELMKSRGRRGGEVRAARFNDLKTKVITRYTQEHTRRSNRQAARLIYQELKADVHAVLVNDDPEKTLEKWIGEYKRKGQPSQA